MLAVRRPGVTEAINELENNNLITCSRGIVQVLNRKGLEKIAGDFYITESIHEVIGVGEAMLAPILSNVVESYPQELIYLKTHPQGYTKENKPRMNLQIVSKGKDKSEVEIRYDAISSKLFDEIKRLGGKIYKAPLDNDIS